MSRYCRYMARSLLGRINKALFPIGLRLLAAMTRTRALRGLADLTLRVLGRASAGLYRVKPETTPAAVGAAWQSVFPSKKMVPITSVDGETVRAEIHVVCPLRGTGDVHACHRLMQYDRSVAARAGANFVVLRSQAEPGVQVCEVALRRMGVPIDDLVPAHERVKPVV